MSSSPLSPAAERLLALVSQHGRLSIAGIPECRAALDLVGRGLVRVESGSITTDGGSGVIVDPNT
jgi:hypothetical protein